MASRAMLQAKRGDYKRVLMNSTTSTRDRVVGAGTSSKGVISTFPWGRRPPSPPQMTPLTLSRVFVKMSIISQSEQANDLSFLVINNGCLSLEC